MRVERRNERAMHETFLVVRAGANDMGSRPLTGSFISSEITVFEGRPRATIWNLGTREVEGVVTEFASVPAGMPVTPANRKIIGHGNPANIPANSCVTVTCTSLWPRMSLADILLVTAYHAGSDPVKAPYDPIADRHCGMMNYPWAGRYEGRYVSAQGLSLKMAVDLRPSNQGLFKVKIYLQTGNRLPTYPQIDRVMAPTGGNFKWVQTFSNRKEDWEINMLDLNRVSARFKLRHADPAVRGEQELSGLVSRIM